MTLTVPQMRAIPLLVLGGGIFVLLALTDVPHDRAAALPERIDVGALHASAPAGQADASACAENTAADCASDGGARLIAVAP
jgi:hypothetical protein